MKWDPKGRFGSAYIEVIVFLHFIKYQEESYTGNNIFKVSRITCCTYPICFYMDYYIKVLNSCLPTDLIIFPKYFRRLYAYNFSKKFKI